MTKEDLQRALDSAPDGCDVLIEDDAGDVYGVASASYDANETGEFLLVTGDLAFGEEEDGWDDDEGELDENPL